MLDDSNVYKVEHIPKYMQRLTLPAPFRSKPKIPELDEWTLITSKRQSRADKSKRKRQRRRKERSCVPNFDNDSVWWEYIPPKEISEFTNEYVKQYIRDHSQIFL